MNRLTGLFLFFLLSGNLVYGQKILTLNKPGPVTRIRYYEQAEISFKLTGENIVHTGRITHLTDSTFLLNELYPITLQNIRMVINYKKGRTARFLHKAFLGGGIMYFGIGTVNRIIDKDAPSLFEGRFLITSAALIGASFIFTPFSNRKYKINKNRYLKVIDVTI